MGSIRNLKSLEYNTHLVYTKSNLAEIYIRDTLKAKCKANNDSIYEISTKSGIDEMLDLVGVQPFLADKWLFILDYKKVKSLFKDKKGIFSMDTSEFIIKVNNYKEYKEVKGILSNVNDIYLAFIRYYDVGFLLQDYSLPQSIVDFVAKSYGYEPEQVFTLEKALRDGEVVTKKKDVVRICGISAGSLNSFAMSLLKDFPTTERGTKMVYSNRIKVALELSDTYGFGKMRNFLLASVKDILDIKTLHMNGVIYDRISDLPDGYDESRLSRYKLYLNSIIETPYYRILNLYLMLKKSGKWYSSVDMMNFIYNYYEGGDI